jgi:hypothetical protein
MYVIGTAGHVDHGKSVLVEALTGIDPDRLREEKERGLTIDLGFAWLTLPSGRQVSLVDVPGHERFIKNMLAGVGGIDLALLVVALLILVNVPVNRYGVSLARILPETTSLIVRDGLVLKGSGPEIYILEEDKLRWVSSLDAFEHLGLSWEDVHVVEDEFLDNFEKGRPIHVLLKCRASPHIYRLENQEKRWIKDIDTFLAEGHVWEDVRFVSCQYLRELPDGPPIPEGAGPPPQP